jgi:hypothetical protein
MDYLRYADSAGILVGLVLIVGLWVDLRCAIARVQASLPKRRMHHTHSLSALPAGGYTLWTYRDGQWKLERDCSAPGFQCGPAPGRAGWYEGEIVKTSCVQSENG